MQLLLIVDVFLVSWIATSAATTILHQFFPRTNVIIERHLISGKPARTAFFALAILWLITIITAIQSQSIEYDTELASLTGAFLYAHGFPLYHDLAYPERYALLYGPYAFLPFSLIFKLGGGLGAARCFGALGLLTAIAAIWLLVRRDQRRNYLVLLPLLIIPFAGNALVAGRSDGWIIAGVSLATLATQQRRPIIVFLAAAIVCGIKLTALAAFIPLIWLLWARKSLGFRSATIGLACFSAITFLPFVLPNIDLENYVFWFAAASRHGLSIGGIAGNLIVAFIILAPLITVLWRSCDQVSREAIGYAIAVMISAVILVIPAAKAGAGYIHILPVLGPMLLGITLLPCPAVSARDYLFAVIQAPLAAMALLLVVPFPRGIFDQTALHVSDAAIRELDDDMAAVPDRARFSIGPGRLEARQSDALFHALTQGGGYLLSDVVIWDMDESGLAIPE